MAVVVVVVPVGEITPVDFQDFLLCPELTQSRASVTDYSSDCQCNS